MATTLDDVLTPDSEDQALAFLLTQLAALGFPTTAWQTGGVAYTLLRVQAKALSNLAGLIAKLARGGLLDYAEKAWLTLLAKGWFQLDRYLSTFAVGQVALTVAPGSGPYTISAGQLWIADNFGHRYNSSNTGSVVLASGTTTQVPFRAENPGAAFNIAVGSGLTLTTPLPGVTAALPDLGTGTWLTTQGTDDESDPALRTRCRTRWATIGLQKPRDAYVYLATNTPGVATPPSRVYVDDANPRGPGTLNVWIAGPAGPVSTADEALVRAYVVARKSPCADVQVANAVPVAVAITADVYYDGGYATALTQAADALTSLINAVPLGGTLSWAEAVGAITNVPGVYDVQNLRLNGGTANLTVAANQTAVAGVYTLTPHIGV